MPSKTPLTGGRWVTIEHEHVYIKKGAIVAGHVPSGTSKSTKSDVDKWVEEGHASRLFKPDDEVRSSYEVETAEKTHSELQKADNAKNKDYENNKAINSAERHALSIHLGTKHSWVVNSILRKKGADYTPRSDDENESFMRHAGNISNAIDKAPSTDQDLVLYRHFTHDPGHQIGENVKTAGFLSTSTASSRQFLVRSGDEDGKFSYEIAVPKGSQSVLQGANPSELEVLLNHGSRFRVLSKKQLGYDIGEGVTQKRTVYQLAYLGPGEK